MSKENAIKIGITVVAATIPPAISSDVLRWIRLTFNTVGIQDPLQELGGDIFFFVVLTVFFLLPWILALSFKFSLIPVWFAILPWTALIIPSFLFKPNIEAACLHYWIAYLGFFAAGLGLAARAPSYSRWLQMVWIPPLIFLAATVYWQSWWDVFFE